MAIWSDELRKRLSDLKLDPAREAEIIAELEQHLEDRYAELLASGQTEQAARDAALREIENTGVLRSELRELNAPYAPPPVFGANGGIMLSDLIQDARYAVRLMIKRPWFSLTIVLTLGVCIGTVGTAFSVIDAALFRALPYPQPGRLAQVVIKMSGHGVFDAETGQDGYGWDAIKNVKSLDVAVYSGGVGGVNFNSGDVVAYLRQQRVSAGYFRVMGVAP